MEKKNNLNPDSSSFDSFQGKNRIELVAPTLKFAEDIFSYKKEFLENGDDMAGTARLREAENLEDWLAAIELNKKEETVQDGLVPATTFLAIRKDNQRLVGMVDIRHRLNDFLLTSGGHIGYSIRKSERRKGFATEMLALALNETKKLGIHDVLITPDKENIASVKTILANHGSLENEVSDGSRVTQRYWVKN